MTNAVVDDFYDSVMPFCAGAPYTSLAYGVRNAIEFFCTFTHVLQEDLTLAAVDGQRDYTLIPTLEGAGDVKIERTLQIKKVSFGGKTLKPTTRRELDRVYSDWEEGESDEPISYFSDEPDTLSIYPIPQGATGNFIVRIATVPKKQAQEYRNVLLEVYKKVIADGAISYIQQIPNTPAFNAESAAVKWQQFEAGIANAKREVIRGFVLR